MKFFDAVDERLKKHCEISKLFVERCLAVSSSAQALDEKQQSVDQRLIEVNKTFFCILLIYKYILFRKQTLSKN